MVFFESGLSKSYLPEEVVKLNKKYGGVVAMNYQDLDTP